MKVHNISVATKYVPCTSIFIVKRVWSMNASLKVKSLLSGKHPFAPKSSNVF